MSVSYFGMQFNMSGLSGNPYLNYILVSGVEVFSYTASWVAARSFSRRRSYASFTLLGALALLLIQITLSLNGEWHDRPLSGSHLFWRSCLLLELTEMPCLSPFSLQLIPLSPCSWWCWANSVFWPATQCCTCSPVSCRLQSSETQPCHPVPPSPDWDPLFRHTCCN